MNVKNTKLDIVNLDNETIQKHLHNQSEQIVLSQKELVVKQQENQNSHDYALEALKASTNNAKYERDFHIKKMFYFMIFTTIIIIVVFLIFIGFLVINKNSDLAMEILRVVLYFGGGVVTGGGIVKSKFFQKKEDF